MQFCIHGDLNWDNILVDLRDTPWLIDFAFTDTGPPFEDAAMACSRLLFDYPRVFERKDASDDEKELLIQHLRDAVRAHFQL